VIHLSKLVMNPLTTMQCLGRGKQAASGLTECSVGCLKQEVPTNDPLLSTDDMQQQSTAGGKEPCQTLGLLPGCCFLAGSYLCYLEIADAGLAT
jgi:hypothetical protein